MSVVPMGVIEGYYGPPWTLDDRRRCIDVLAEHGGNAYVWAPKSEPRHRDAWEEPFTDAERTGFAAVAGRSSDVMVSVGLTPGAGASVDQVIAKVGPALDAGCTGVTLCFDDLPELAAADAHRTIANGVAERTDVAVWVVPTHYAGVESSPYLESLVDGLREDILVMWTGYAVVNDTITADDARRRTALSAGRAPLLWDNTPVNDAVMTSLLHLGPYTGRESALRDEIGGVLLNPMPSLTASLPTIVSACAWWQGADPVAAWSKTVDDLGLRVLAEATAFPGDAHWPSDTPAREWWESVRDMSAAADSYVQPWIDAARTGASIALAALDALDRLTAGADPASLVRQFLQMSALDAWLRSPVRTLGSGPRTRPVWTQDHRGRFSPSPGSIDLTTSMLEHLVAQVDAALRERTAS